MINNFLIKFTFFTGDIKKGRYGKKIGVLLPEHKNIHTGRDKKFQMAILELCMSPSLPGVMKGGQNMGTFKQGNRWRWNEPSRVKKFFKCNLKSILETKPGLTTTKLARLLNKSVTTVSNWINGYEIPPSDIQEMIAMIVGAKNRAEIWQWKGKNLTRYLLKMHRLNEELQNMENLIQQEIAVDFEDRG
ncbi:MAG TPA: XRE family transcriptional regulator [Thermoplasmata archaeon]|nr:XRE family transcriptional regulator [Thermoplasmata archaeon]